MSLVGGHTDKCPGRDPFVRYDYVQVSYAYGREAGPALGVVEAIIDGADATSLDEMTDVIGADHLRESAVELVLLLARNMSRPVVTFHGDQPDERTGSVVDHVLEFLSHHTVVSFLLIRAQELEFRDHQHRQTCRPCRSADMSPLMARSRLCRDIADEIALEHHTEMAIHEIPPVVALDVAQILLAHASNNGAGTPAEQISELRRSLAEHIGAEGQ